MLVQEFLTRSAARLPDKTALICGAKRYTYAELDQMSDRLGNALKDRGFTRGDRLAIHLPNSLETVVGVFAALKAGGTFVLVNASTKPDKLKYILNNCRARVLLMGARAEGLETLWDEVPSLIYGVLCGPGGAPAADSRLARFEAVQEGAAPGPLPPLGIDLDLACLVYTSGSTGEPKGVMCDHSNVDFASSSIMTYLETGEDDIILSVLPLSFDYGLYQMLMAFKAGATLVLERTFTYPALILQRIQEERVTVFPGVPTIFTMLLQMDRSTFDLSSLRTLTNTAAALSPRHLEEIQEAFPAARLFSMYGLTETKRTLYLPPDQLAIRPGSVGIPIPGTEAWLEVDGRRLEPGGTGELVVRGRHVMRGYWEAPEATAKRYRPGALPGERLCYSGDLFRTDEEGYFYFVGRQDDIIKSRGEKVAPKEVENVIHLLKDVTASAVVGVPDPTAGEVIKAFVVAREGSLTEAQVIAHCRAHLEDFMVPRFVEFRDELPMTSSGKISKIGLR
jgi:amino acid adenylation domain-containing protein